MEHFPWIFAVWVGAIILFNIVGAIRKARKALAVRPQDLPVMPPPAQAAPSVHEQAFASMPSPDMPQPYAVPEPVVVQAPIVVKRAKVPKPAQKAVPEHLVPDPDHAFRSVRAQQDGTLPLRGMFARENLARAFIAAQVFGPPKALQEQSIWSPRHSEPSI